MSNEIEKMNASQIKLLTTDNICANIKKEMVSGNKLSVQRIIDDYLLESVTKSLEKDNFIVEKKHSYELAKLTTIIVYCP